MRYFKILYFVMMTSTLHMTHRRHAECHVEREETVTMPMCPVFSNSKVLLIVSTNHRSAFICVDQ